MPLLTLPPIDRRRLLASALALTVSSAWAAKSERAIEVWKDPNCGCCNDWVTHLEGAGFKVTIHQVGNEAARERLGMPKQLGSCHTARVGGSIWRIWCVIAC